MEYKVVTASNLDEAISAFSEEIKSFDIPSDGLVALYDDIAFGTSLGRTTKFPRNAFAFKWKDETAETTLEEIEWSASRTGLINPVAVFAPVELEGTTVSRASVHNISIVRSLRLGIGDRITVYKANMIIPQIAENLTGSDTAPIPEVCPVCGHPTVIHEVGEVRTLYCPNKDCLAKHIKALTLFVSRDAMNIEGLSQATLEKFVENGIIHSFRDLYHLEEHRDKILSMEGFGEKSYANLISQIDRSRKTTLVKLLYSLGIEGVGAANARLICDAFNYDLDTIRKADASRLQAIDGIGPVLAQSFSGWFADQDHNRKLDALLAELQIEEGGRTQAGNKLTGKVFVITGSVEHFANRNELKALIEEQGGKVTGSVSANTDYLINNDSTSTSSKNVKAAKLGIPVITEADFLKMLE